MQGYMGKHQGWSAGRSEGPELWARAFIAVCTEGMGKAGQAGLGWLV